MRAWLLYDWANSAFMTTVVSAVLPVYFATVAGATLPSAARATQVFSLTTSVALGVTAVVSPLVGAYSDLAAAKKRLLAVAVAVAATATGALALVGEGDWLLAAVLFGFGRLGFGVANVLYDALLPHVARPEDQDRVSAQGFALGYLGGGLLLAANVGMILAYDGLGTRLSFLSVGVWWILFSVPLFRHVPEPPVLEGAAPASLRATVRQAVATLTDLRRFRDLRRFLVAFLIYNDAINVVIAVAALYGAELGFGATELLLAILLVQITGVPYSLAFGRLPAGRGRRHAFVTAFVALNIVLLPVVGIGGRLLLPADVAGRRPAAPPAGAGEAGVGEVDVTDAAVVADAAVDLRREGPYGDGTPVVVSDGEPIGLRYVGRDVEVRYVSGPSHGEFSIEVDGAPVLDDGEPLIIDASGTVERVGNEVTVPVDDVGEHVLTVRPTGQPGENGTGTAVAVTGFEVLPLRRDADLPVVLGLLLGLQAIIALLALAVAPLLRERADRIDTKGGIQLALVAYLVVAVWGFALDTVIEFWALAWLVSVVQGGSQALSRSLYATLAPDLRSGEFFGLFSILSKLASFISPLLFVASVALFDSSRPAVLALAVMFLAGLALLRRVDVAAGRALADAEDARLRT